MTGDFVRVVLFCAANHWYRCRFTQWKQSYYHWNITPGNERITELLLLIDGFVVMKPVADPVCTFPGASAPGVREHNGPGGESSARTRWWELTTDPGVRVHHGPWGESSQRTRGCELHTDPGVRALHGPVVWELPTDPGVRARHDPRTPSYYQKNGYQINGMSNSTLTPFNIDFRHITDLFSWYTLIVNYMWNMNRRNFTKQTYVIFRAELSIHDRFSIVKQKRIHLRIWRTTLYGRTRSLL